MNCFIPQNPTVVILIDENGKFVSAANNVDPELNIVITRSPEQFADETLNQPFQTPSVVEENRDIEPVNTI